MKKRIQEQFGDNIIISERKGTPNIITLRRTAFPILDEFKEREATP